MGAVDGAVGDSCEAGDAVSVAVGVSGGVWVVDVSVAVDVSVDVDDVSVAVDVDDAVGDAPSVDAVGGSRVAGDVLDSLLRASMSSQMFVSLPVIAWVAAIRFDLGKKLILITTKSNDVIIIRRRKNIKRW